MVHPGNQRTDAPRAKCLRNHAEPIPLGQSVCETTPNQEIMADGTSRMTQFKSNPKSKIAEGTQELYFRLPPTSADDKCRLRTASRRVTEVITATRGGVDVIIGSLQYFESSRKCGPLGCGEREHLDSRACVYKKCISLQREAN